jgi:glycosyltransferase involved in cell wall biosynthesis
MISVTYLSFDSLQEGVGASQVLSYMTKVSKTRPVTIISFEKLLPSEKFKFDVEQTGIVWIPLPFGKYGPLGGLLRVLRMAKRVDKQQIVHARGALSGLVALISRSPIWVWDCRSLHADQRLALKSGHRITMEFLLMRICENFLAKQSTHIITITNAVVPLFISRYKIKREKITVIPTCVDTERFFPMKSSKSSELKILLQGTFSPAYDLQMMKLIISELKKNSRVLVTIATSQGSTMHWEQIPYDNLISVTHDEMPDLIRRHDMGMSIWKDNLGVSLLSVASTKTAEFLACGKPIFVNSMQGDFGSLVAKYNVGVVTSRDSPQFISRYAEQMLSLLKDPDLSTRCRSVSEGELNLLHGIDKLLKIYSSLEVQWESNSVNQAARQR